MSGDCPHCGVDTIPTSTVGYQFNKPLEGFLWALSLGIFGQPHHEYHCPSCGGSWREPVKFNQKRNSGKMKIVKK